MSEEWIRNPVWFSQSIKEISKPVLDDKTLQIWERALKLTAEKDLIVNCVSGVSTQSMVAKIRYQHLNRIQAECNEWPFFLILLAECHYLMSDIYGAYTRIKRAQIMIGNGTDKVLDYAVNNLKEMVDGVTEMEPSSNDIHVVHYSRPNAFNGNYQIDIDSIQTVWTQFKESFRCNRFGVV